MAEWIQMVEETSAPPTLMPTPWPHYTSEGESRSMDEGGIVFVSSLAESQEKVLAILLVLSAALSIFGSAAIMSKVLRNGSKAALYDRLMFGLSTCDVIASLTCAMQPFLLPADTSRRIWAIGTDATCSFLGFLTQLSFAAMMYNGVLSYYFLLTIRFGWKPKKIAHHEMLMHFSAVLFPLATASIGLAFGVFHEVDVGFGSWTANYPEGCEGEECTSYRWGYVFGMIPVAFSFGSLLVNNIIILCHVRSTLGTTQQQPAFCRSGYLGKGDGGDEDMGDVPQTHDEQARSKQNARDEVRQKHIRVIATQGFLYVGTFLFSYWSPLVLRIVEHQIDGLNEGTMFPLLLMQSICWPLQGFFNMLVYIRPSYVRVRAAYPELSQWAAMQRAYFEPNVPRFSDLTSPRGNNTPETNVCGESADRIMELDRFQEIRRTENTSSSITGTSSSFLTSSSFFGPLPGDEYFSACVQSVLSASRRSLSQGPGTTTSPVDVAEECPCGEVFFQLPLVAESNGSDADSNLNRDSAEANVAEQTPQRNAAPAAFSSALHVMQTPSSSTRYAAHNSIPNEDTKEETIDIAYASSHNGDEYNFVLPNGFLVFTPVTTSAATAQRLDERRIVQRSVPPSSARRLNTSRSLRIRMDGELQGEENFAVLAGDDHRYAEGESKQRG